MRKEPFSIDSYVHVYKRGARQSPIVRDDADRWRFLRLLHYLNDANVPRNWERELSLEELRAFLRPDGWPEPKPYVSVLAYCLLDNHFHLLLREREEGGIAKFMQRLCTSMSANFNAKYQENGTLFQGAYQARTVQSDDQLRYLSAYIQLKNTLDMHPEGFDRAVRDIESAMRWALAYPFSSYGDYIREPRAFILDTTLITDILETGDAFERLARDLVASRAAVLEEISNLLLDD